MLVPVADVKVVRPTLVRPEIYIFVEVTEVPVAEVKPSSLDRVPPVSKR
mgnify:CR=1 FL=1